MTLPVFLITFHSRNPIQQKILHLHTVHKIKQVKYSVFICELKMPFIILILHVSPDRKGRRYWLPFTVANSKYALQPHLQLSILQ